MAINPDELEPPKPKAVLKDLSVMSIEELRDYISTLQAEIRRTEETISKKETQKSVAAAFFKN